jgi:hypothetical protein
VLFLMVGVVGTVVLVSRYLPIDRGDWIRVAVVTAAASALELAIMFQPVAAAGVVVVDWGDWTSPWPVGRPAW